MSQAVSRRAESIFHRWRNQYGGVKADDAKGLRELEHENSTLKRMMSGTAPFLPHGSVPGSGAPKPPSC